MLILLVESTRYMGGNSKEFTPGERCPWGGDCESSGYCRNAHALVADSPTETGVYKGNVDNPYNSQERTPSDCGHPTYTATLTKIRRINKNVLKEARRYHGRGQVQISVFNVASRRTQVVGYQ